MTTANHYDTIAARNTVRRTRDLAFAILLAVGAAFSIGSINSAAHRVAQASAAPAPASAQAAPLVAGTCSLDTSC